jgi:hypothetical protein
MDKINKIIDKYYSLLENKPANLIEMSKNTMLSSNKLEVNDVFKEKDVLVCIHISYLIDLKSEGEKIVNTKPIDNEVFEIFIEDLEIACEKAMDAIIEYEKEQIESIPRESTLYFLLNDDKGFFNLDEMSAEEKKNIDAILSDLETGLFDYERKRNGHTIVKQSVRRDLNVFVNRKRNTCVSFIRINKEGFKESKVLVLGIDDFRKIFDTSKSILKTNSSLIDESVEKIIAQDEEFERKEQEFKDSLKDMLSKEEVKSK